MVAADEKLVIFGGHFLSGGSEEKGGEESRFAYLNEVWVFDIRREEWHKMDCAGEKKNIPQPRYGHSALLFGARMFIFGGKGEKNQLFNDIFFLDLVEWRWESVTSLSKPPVPRLFHAFEQVGRKMVIHGGWDGNSSFSDLHIFDTDSFTWTSPSTTGFVPSSRYG